MAVSSIEAGEVVSVFAGESMEEDELASEASIERGSLSESDEELQVDSLEGSGEIMVSRR